MSEEPRVTIAIASAGIIFSSLPVDITVAEVEALLDTGRLARKMIERRDDRREKEAGR